MKIEIFKSHFSEKNKKMPKVNVNQEKCIGCGACVSTCPSSVFEMKDGKAAVVKEDACIACHACVGVCPVEAIKVED